MKRFFFFSFSFILMLALNGFQVVDNIRKPPFPPKEERARCLHPQAGIPRAAGTPLVALIPGLNVPGARIDNEQFGCLLPMLEKAGFPTFVVSYDGQKNPGDLPMIKKRIFSALETGIKEENEIRKKKNVPPVQEV